MPQNSKQIYLCFPTSKGGGSWSWECILSDHPCKQRIHFWTIFNKLEAFIAWIGESPICPQASNIRPHFHRFIWGSIISLGLSGAALWKDQRWWWICIAGHRWWMNANQRRPIHHQCCPGGAGCNWYFGLLICHYRVFIGMLLGCWGVQFLMFNDAIGIFMIFMGSLWSNWF